MFACLSGNSEYVQFSIEHISLNKSVLSFNYIFSGSLETTKVLLEAGADKGAQNDINRTAAQLGAFTGELSCTIFVMLPSLETRVKHKTVCNILFIFM